MAVHAHPDDESSKGAATYAYYLDRGVEVMVVSCTGGERGSVLNEKLEPRAWAERSPVAATAGRTTSGLDIGLPVRTDGDQDDLCTVPTTSRSAS